jgi:hypothetical protein
VILLKVGLLAYALLIHEWNEMKTAVNLALDYVHHPAKYSNKNIKTRGSIKIRD